MTDFDLPARSAISPDVLLDGTEDSGFTESPFAIDPGPTPHHLDQGPEHLRSTPNVHEQDEVEDPEAKAVGGGGGPAREIIIDHLANCALDDRALPAVELACEVRRQLLGRGGTEGCPSWALKLYRMGGPAATHTLPSEHGEALQDVAAVFAEAMQAAVDKARKIAAEEQVSADLRLVDMVAARRPFEVQVGDSVTTLSGLTGLVSDVNEGGFKAKLDYGDGDEGTEFRYSRTGLPIILTSDSPLGVPCASLSATDAYPLIERLRITIAFTSRKES